MATGGERSSCLAGEELVEISLSEDVEDALMMMCLTQLAQGGGAPILAVAGNEELLATGCPDLEGRITRHGGAVGVMEESGGEGGGL